MSSHASQLALAPQESPTLPSTSSIVNIAKTPKYFRRILQGLQLSRRHLQATPTCYYNLTGSLEQVPLSRLFPSDPPFPVPISVSLCPAQPILNRPDFRIAPLRSGFNTVRLTLRFIRIRSELNLGQLWASYFSLF